MLGIKYANETRKAHVVADAAADGRIRPRRTGRPPDAETTKGSENDDRPTPMSVRPRRRFRATLATRQSAVAAGPSLGQRRQRREGHGAPAASGQHRARGYSVDPVARPAGGAGIGPVPRGGGRAAVGSRPGPPAGQPGFAAGGLPARGGRRAVRSSRPGRAVRSAGVRRHAHAGRGANPGRAALRRVRQEADAGDRPCTH